MTIANAFIATPLLVLAYALTRIWDGLDGVRSPGLAWTAGHLAFAAALLLFVPILLKLRRLAGAGWFATVVTAIGLFGIAAFLVQFGIDIVAGLLAADRAELSRLTDQMTDLPGLAPVVYAFGPMLFYTALVTLVIVAAARRSAPVWAAVLVTVGSIAPTVSKELLPVTALCLLVGFLPLARSVRDFRTPAPVSA